MGIQSLRCERQRSSILRALDLKCHKYAMQKIRISTPGRESHVSEAKLAAAFVPVQIHLCVPSLAPLTAV